MNKRKQKQIERITSACRALGAYPFQCHSCDPAYNAKRNLSGRTHYVDEDTLKYFDAQILQSRKTEDGLLFWLIESVRSRPNHGGYTRRFVPFDVFGEVLDDRNHWCQTTDKAVKYGRKWLEDFDVIVHYRAKIKNEIERRRNEALVASKALLAKV